MENNSTSNIPIHLIIFIIGTIIAFVCLFNDHFFWFIFIMAITGGIASAIWQDRQKKKKNEKQSIN